MKVERLKIHNLKRISDLDLAPQGSLVVISGKNGAGKSTVIDSIMIAIGGAKHIPAKPVKRGEDKALIEVDLGELNVKRTITPDGGSTLVVRNRDGVRQESPQGILDALFGMLTFDPQAFRNAAGPKRFEMLSELVGLKFEEIDGQIDVVYVERTAINREVKSFEARVLAQKEYPDAPKEEVSAAEILKEQQKAAAKNSENAQKRRKLEALQKWCGEQKGTVEGLKDQIDEAEKSLLRLKQRLAKETEELKMGEATVQGGVADCEKLIDIDLTPFVEKAKSVEADNAKVRANRAKEELRQQLKKKSDEAESLSNKIEKLEKQKREQITSAKYPVEGLALSDDRQVLFNGTPFDQASTGEQIRVSVAMGLAMNSKLNILLIRQGNDLDVDNLKLVAEMAEKAGAQIWIEKISSEGGAQVILEEGHVKGAEQKELV